MLHRHVIFLLKGPVKSDHVRNQSQHPQLHHTDTQMLHDVHSNAGILLQHLERNCNYIIIKQNEAINQSFTGSALIRVT